MKHIVLTGGGTAGHVTPNIALIPRLKELGYEISYICPKPRAAWICRDWTSTLF